MTLREDLLPLVDACRQITEDLDQRTTGLTIRVRTWSGATIGQTLDADNEVAIDANSEDVQVDTTSNAVQVERSYVDSDLVFPRRYHCRILSDKDTTQVITASGGRFEPGRYVKMWMTPSFPGGGYQQTDLVPVVNNDNQEVIYVLSGLGLNGEYTLVSFNADRPYRYEMILRQKNTSSRP